MFLIKKKNKFDRRNTKAVATCIKKYVGLNQGNFDIFSRAAKDYAVQSCLDNIASLNYGIENKLISGKPYTMSELYEQAIQAEKAFTAGIQWALRHTKE
jgi:hypothetical protein